MWGLAFVGEDIAITPCSDDGPKTYLDANMACTKINLADFETVNRTIKDSDNDRSTEFPSSPISKHFATDYGRNEMNARYQKNVGRDSRLQVSRGFRNENSNFLKRA